MGSAAPPEAPPSACIEGEAIQVSNTISECQWANAQTGVNSVRLMVNPSEQHSRHSPGEILDAFFSTQVSFCGDASSPDCGDRPARLIGRIMGQGETLLFKAGADTFMEGKIKSYNNNGVTYFGFDSCICR